jgi:mannan endo-1,4-beta-mannosidase
MHTAQRALTDFLPQVEWNRFKRRTLNDDVALDNDFASFGCGDRDQAVLWLLRRVDLTAAGTLDRRVAGRILRLRVAGLSPGVYRITTWNTEKGEIERQFTAECQGGDLHFEVTVVRDLAVAIRPAAWSSPSRG